MQVPRSAIGKMGQCPSCGEKIPITRETTSRTRRASMAKGSPTRGRWGTAGPSIDAKQQFGRAVDLYCAGKYGEALVIFDALSQEFPDSSEIRRARRQCIDARNRDPLNLPGPASGQVMGDQIDDEILREMRRMVVEKMFHGESDAVRLQAAELVARMGGVLDGPPPGEPAGDAAERQDGPEAGASGDRADAGGNGRTHDLSVEDPRDASDEVPR